MYRISPFTPIFFKPSADRHGVKPKCVHVFSKTDRILIEVIAVGETSAPPLVVSNILSGRDFTYSWQEWEMNESTTLYFKELQGMDEGMYVVTIGGNVTSEAFIVTSDEDALQDTVLIQYSNTDNRQRNDVVFWIDGMQRFFDFRVPGGFKDDNWTFAVNNEQFVTSDNDKLDLFGQESTIKALTLGNSEGCPVWFAELLNRLLCCNYVYVDKVRYARNESEVPEMNAEVEGLKSYIFTQGLQRVVNLNPTLENRNLLVMRRVVLNNTDKYRVSSKTVDSETGDVTDATFNIIV
jgi:hypothetical protein